jgi:indole-3-glycerol phosphate synthase
LRKDFVVDERQLFETAALGADAVLLIAGILKEELPHFVRVSRHLGIEPLVEVHNQDEALMALQTDAVLIGINNRDLGTMEIDLDTTLNLSEPIHQEGRLVISESGIRSADDIRRLKNHTDAFLIGTAIMASDDPGKKLEEFVFA